MIIVITLVSPANRIPQLAERVDDKAITGLPDGHDCLPLRQVGNVPAGGSPPTLYHTALPSLEALGQMGNGFAFTGCDSCLTQKDLNRLQATIRKCQRDAAQGSIFRCHRSGT